MIHPAAVLRPISAELGHGVFTTIPIPAGTVTWVRDPLDQALPAARVRALAPALQEQVRRYAYQDLSGDLVLCWDHARFNNHSCAPACRTIGDFDIAIRDIPAGGELSIDYAMINYPETLSCGCGEPGCRGTVDDSDADRFGERWDAEVRNAAQWITAVEQPLAPLFGGSAALASAIADLHAGRAPSLPSSRDLILRVARVR